MKKHLKAIKHSPLVYKLRKNAFCAFEFLTSNYYERTTFYNRTGYKPNLKNPKSFCEKICWRKLYDRNPLFTRIADKYEVRNVLKEILGEDEAKKILIPLLHVTEDPETIPFDELPEEYIIKANHGSGTNIIIEAGQHIDRDQIIQQCKHWLALPHGYEKHEWAYKDIPRKIIVETLIRDENGELPNDYKYHMIHGECVHIQYVQDRFSDETFRTTTLVDTDWKKIDVKWNFPSLDKAPNRPQGADEMLKYAEILSAPFDYVRVDLYLIQGKIYFGELTLYPASGKFPVEPLSYDYEVGAKWNLDTAK